MNACLSEFRDALRSLAHYLEGFDVTTHLLSYTPATPGIADSHMIRIFQAHFSEQATRRREFEYNSIIVSLYGLFEGFVEGMLLSFLSRVRTIVPTYTDLPESLRLSHLDLALEVLRNRDSTRYSGLPVAKFIADLSSCLNDKGAAIFDPLPFRHHTANFRVPVMRECFGKVGIPSIDHEVASHSAVRSFLEAHNPELSVETLNPESALSRLTDLVERRNDVAHGVAGNILSNTILSEYIEFLDCVGVAISDSCREALLPYYVGFASEHLGEPLAVHDNRIVCFDSPLPLDVGDVLIARSKDAKGRYVAGPIHGIQCDHTVVDHFDPGMFGHNQVACRVEFHANPNHVYRVARRTSFAEGEI